MRICQGLVVVVRGVGGGGAGALPGEVPGLEQAQDVEDDCRGHAGLGLAALGTDMRHREDGAQGGLFGLG